MSERPNITIVPWATDLNYPSGSNPWSLTNTKIAPSGSEYAHGYTPGVQPRAQHWNYVQNALTSWVSAADGYECRNWPTRASGIQFDLNCGAYDANRNLLYLGGKQTGDHGAVLISGAGGVGLDVVVTPFKQFPGGTSSRVIDMAIRPDTGDLFCLAVYTDIAPDDHFSALVATYDVSANAWADRFVPGDGDSTHATTAHSIKWDPYRLTMIIGGTRFTNFGSSWIESAFAWFCDDPGFDPTNASWSAVYVSSITLIATGPANMLLCDRVNTWTSAAVTDAFVQHTGVFTKCLGLEYNASTGTYLALDQATSTLVRVWGSVDGIIWTLRSTLPSTSVVNSPGTLVGSAVAENPSTNVLRAWGSAWVWAGTITTSGAQVILYSLDNGSSWRFVPCPSIVETALFPADGGIGLIGSHPGVYLSRLCAMLR